MHHEFYIKNNKNLTKLEEINTKFSSAKKIKEYLKNQIIICGYLENCKAILIPALITETQVVYLRSKKNQDHLFNCPFHDLYKLKNNLIKYKSLNFLFRGLPKRVRNTYGDEINKLIASKYKGAHINLAELFDLLRNDPELNFLKETSFINPEYCKEWYEKSHGKINNPVLLTGVLNRKFYSCQVTKQCENSYDCHSKHEPRDYKLEILEKDIEFHISVSKEIYYSINSNGIFHHIKKMYHILAKINEMNRSNKENKRFYTKNSKKVNHVVKNKNFVKLIEN